MYSSSDDTYPYACEFGAMKPADVPGFVATPVTSVSGRLMTGFGLSGGSAAPCVLAAHYLPTFRGLGSAVYVLALVGPSDGSFPFWPVAGITVDEGSLRVLRAVDDNYCNFEYTGDAIDFDEFDVEIDDVDSLLEATLRLAAEELKLGPWDAEAASEFIDASEGWDYFDEFSALGIQEFPAASADLED